MPPPFVARLRRARPALGLALGVGLASVLLTAAVARQLVGIGEDASALAERWIARAATLADVEATLRTFRQGEARHALAPASPVRDSLATVLDATIATGDRLVAALADGVDGEGTDRAAVDTLRARWSGYVRQHRLDRSLAGGEGGPALDAFRQREARYTALSAATRTIGDGLRSGAGRIATRSRRTTLVSAALLAGSVVLTLAALALAETVRRAAQARSEAERRWRELTEQDLGLVWEVDATGRLRFVSAAALDLLGCPAHDVLGRRLLALVPPDDRRTVVAQVRRARETGAPLRDLELRLVRGDGTVAWLAAAGRVLDEAPDRAAGLRGLAVDITRRTQAEAALEQGRRLEAIGTLAGGVAHDLNNVFAAIAGHAQLARLADEVDPQLRDDLGAIDQAATRGATLVRRILQFARRQPTERVPVVVQAIVDEVIALLRPQLPPTIAIVRTADGAAAEVLADPAELHQVIVNLASNAVHAMRRHGGTLRIAVDADDTSVRVAVDDDGDGMSPAVLARALEPFFTTRPVGEGTGMGLAVAHGVVHGLGGTLTLASQPGVGTQVRITVPRHLAPAAVCDTLAADTPAPDAAPGAAAAHGVAPRVTPSVVLRDRRRVLLVDDDPLVLRTVARALTRAGHAVECHGAATTALAALRGVPARADVIVTDLTMPGQTGLDLVRALRAAGIGTPVILCSGYLDAPTATDARGLGVTQLLDKPVATAVLLEAIARSATGRAAA